ncbi:sialate O-acetylesterase [Pelagicoccus mobilis]|uniref:Sialate O-acetylesterase n=1 Tax=Pelagicoccus mobilis TaxID=415221 RepID=A0A934S0V3_9BACT|nr:sialate O-acetylesterase [Pelagicoccus mobilis]MBK1879120.1 sialate O-acetylesterase [Pelagicoccus mobilis]
MKPTISLIAASFLLTIPAIADISLPNVFTDHMVIQRDQENPIWGTAEANEKIKISIGGKKVSTKADKEGNWRTELPAFPAGGPHTITIKGSSTVSIEDVLVGEVWFCSGQSNMEWPVRLSYGAEVEATAANHPKIRFLHVPNHGTDQPQDNFEGQWEVCSPDTAPHFSAVGYYYGQTLHAALGVPIGLIDNAWGGSAAEAWVPREKLENDGRFEEMLNHWDERVTNFDQVAYEDYVKRYNEWAASGFKGEPMEWNKTVHPITGQHRPSNIYNGMVHPLSGYGIRGVIWYQGESNGDRAEQYRHLFPLMVETWRDNWGQGDFPFYWVQLADWQEEVDTPGDSGWAELREAQTLSMDVLPNSGQAVIIDIGEGRDIHPRNKKTVASRLVRWPLANIHGHDISYQSPRYSYSEINGNRIRVTLDHVSGGGLWAFDTQEIKGFSIAGEDQSFVWAQAKIIDQNTIEVWSDEIELPVAVRYGWAQNPVINLFDRNGLPVTPFRTDDWPVTSTGKVK